jgi:hypothetical protein
MLELLDMQSLEIRRIYWFLHHFLFHEHNQSHQLM